MFGTHIGNGLPSGRKLLRKKLIGDKVAAYYDHGEPMKDPMIVSLDAERRVQGPAVPLKIVELVQSARLQNGSLLYADEASNWLH